MIKIKHIIAITLVSLLIFSSVFAVTQHSPDQHSSSGTVDSRALSYSLPYILDNEKYVAVPAEKCSVQSDYTSQYNGSLHVMVTFSLSNQSRLCSLLANLSNSQSEQYHKYLTRSEFTDNFSVSSNLYDEAVGYFSQFPGISITRYADRVSLGISGPANEVGAIFNTTIMTDGVSKQLFFARSMPELPVSLSKYVSDVTGLTNRHMNVSLLSEFNRITDANLESPALDHCYPAPLNQNGTQYIYGSDLQVAYDEQSLLNITYPTKEVVATILWAGFNKTCQPVGPFVPSNIYAYYNATLPSYEPHPEIYGVPLNGAVKPGKSAAYDITEANVENTLDLEMVGSTAPGAKIFNVYGQNCTNESIDSAFAFILNPNSTYKALNNVSVITNSWGDKDCNNTVWYEYLQEAQARGITVMASSGDSGDDNSSQRYVGSTCDFPSAMAYNDFGVTAVGGDTLILSANLHIENETAWYESTAYTHGAPYGSTGGISTIFPEPQWQLNTEANNVIDGKGRGVPDISAIANNTIMFITLCTNACGSYSVAGTSISSPLDAGIVAEMNAIMKYYNESTLGFLNPQVYSLANREDLSLQSADTTGYIPTGSYNSTLPTLPFHDVYHGRNHLYRAVYGYNLVTGWGSIDAYNMSMYLVNVNRSSSSIGITGVEDILNLTDLRVTSYLYNSSTEKYSTVNQYYNASVQQNFFVANQFGAPIYWIQNVIYINGSQTTGWIVNYTGWIVYPFYGQYPSLAVYEYNFPSGERIYMPHEFNVKTWLTNLTDPMHEMMHFQVNSHVVKIPVPGAAYIIMGRNYNYSWQGHTYENGPYPGNPYYGGLNPQFGLVGGPSGGLGRFQSPTSGSIFAYVEPLNSDTYIPALSEPFNGSIDETGETACSLSFSGYGNSWTLNTSAGSSLQGIVDFGVSPEKYSVTFNGKGIRSGTQWNVTVNGITYSSVSNSITLSLPNGSYSAFFSYPNGYVPSPDEYIFTISGAGLQLNITYSFSINSTFIKAVNTIFPADHEKFQGDVFNLSYYDEGYLSLGMAYDSSDGMIFIPMYSTVTGMGDLFQYNISSGLMVGSDGIPSYDVIYDTENGFLYSLSPSGILSEILASSLTVERNLSLPQWYNNNTILDQNGSYIFALSSKGYLAQIYASNLTVGRSFYISSLESDNIPTPFFVSGNNVYLPNAVSDALMIINISSGSVKNLSLPSGYDPLSVLQYQGTDILIGGKTASYEIFNTSSLLFTTIPDIQGTATSTTYDPLSNTIFVFSSLNSLDIPGMITDIAVNNGSSLATLPDNGMIPYAVFDPLSQGIIADISAGMLSSFSVMHFFNVTFTENGLPSGEYWYVNLSNGDRSGPVTDSSHSFILPNGTYSFTVSTEDRTFHASQPTGSFFVNDESTYLNVTFSRVSYNVTFNETGLSSGTAWYVNLSSGIDSGPIVSSSYSFFLVNGSYYYSVSDNGRLYSPSPSHGNFNVSGPGTTITIEFTMVTYPVKFTESGLPSHVSWYVNITGLPGSGPITANSYVVSLHNGSYQFSVSSDDRFYTPKVYNSSFIVDGNPVNTSNIVFVPVNFTLTFTETGLGAGIWFVNLSNGENGSASAGYNITFLLPNGSFSYTIAASDRSFYPSSYSGSVSVSGNKTIHITFYLKVYSVVFNESGLPPGEAWYVNITEGQYSGEISGASFTFLLPNGSYTFTVAGQDHIYYPSPSSGTFNISGSSVPENITFYSLGHYVYFNEQGLDPGVKWYLNGSSLSGMAIAPESITFILVNGTYTFSATNLSLFYTTTPHFTLTVDGSNISESVQYLQWSYITGTISPPDSTILLNGNILHLSPSGSFNMSVPNGTYNLVAYSSGYITYYSNFTLNPGSVEKMTIDLSAQKLNTPVDDKTYIVIALLLAIAAIGSVVEGKRRRK